ncbi:exosortase K [Halpernia humi]|uniref:Exosortase K n=2 Tax=Halpernia humi TaxID=493375 RepID=A0A1H5WJ55_9FLAO|nr:exosortase K [Halpernia humi]
MYGALAILMFIILKFWYANSTNSEVFFLLKPTDFFINIITSSTSIFKQDIGFFNETLNIIINKSCSGFNFLMIAFLMLIFLALKSKNLSKFTVLIIPISLFISYLFTVFVNTTRILFSIYMNHYVGNKFSWMHQTEGTFVYMSFLIILYLLVNQFLTKFRNEKFA